MSQSSLAQEFLALHVKSDPVVLYNIWDAGGAQAVAEAGAKAVATSSWSIAAAHGFADGEQITLDFALSIYERIVAGTTLPVTVDFEGGYATDATDITANVTRLLKTGAIGLNFEDQVVGGDGLYGIADQFDRVAAVRSSAISANIPAVINARTDLFLKEEDSTKHAALVTEAIERGVAYQKAGADCYFIPGLGNEALIKAICEACELPVNVMVLDTQADLKNLKKTGVARISYGPAPYIASMNEIGTAAKRQF